MLHVHDVLAWTKKANSVTPIDLATMPLVGARGVEFEVSEHAPCKVIRMSRSTPRNPAAFRPAPVSQGPADRWHRLVP